MSCAPRWPGLRPRACGLVLERVLVLGHVNDAMDIDAGQVDVVGIDRAVIDEAIAFNDRQLRGGCHHRVEVSRRLPESQIAELVARLRTDERDVTGQCALEDVAPAIDLAGLLALLDDRSCARRGEE